MDAELKAKWVTALRSDKYKQSTLSLRNSDCEDGPSFCCLGVLAEIQGASWKNDDRPFINGERASHKRGGWIDEKFSGGIPLAEQETLARMNDRHRPFPEIADYIEKNL